MHYPTSRMSEHDWQWHGNSPNIHNTLHTFHGHLCIKVLSELGGVKWYSKMVIMQRTCMSIYAIHYYHHSFWKAKQYNRNMITQREHTCYSGKSTLALNRISISWDAPECPQHVSKLYTPNVESHLAIYTTIGFLYFAVIVGYRLHFPSSRGKICVYIYTYYGV